MNDSFSQKLNKESKLREEMLDDAIKYMENISDKKSNEEKSIEQYKIEEIKYKTTIKELNEYVDIYKNKIESLENQTKNDNNELINLRKKSLQDDKDITTLKSILDLLITECGIDKISQITKIDEEKLKGYVE